MLFMVPKCGKERKNEAKVQRTHRNIGMDVVLFSIPTDETTAQLIHRGVQDPEPFVALGKYLLQRFDFQLQGV